ncbi:unnamed protein product [Schistocephalus solidus]|uniref:Uncharacterized protein n=1 Tax=Schistocephalus solidus TaxID=70667 RepID=A0A183TPA8_SCHSO|nr:unnamed protein product [Schistocephalus solidus]
METIEAWHTEPTSIKCCVALPAAYQALRAQLIELESKHGTRPNVNSTAGDSRTDMHITVPQFGADEGAVMNTAASITTPTDKEACPKDKNMTIDFWVPIQVNADPENGRPPQPETCQLTAISRVYAGKERQSQKMNPPPCASIVYTVKVNPFNTRCVTKNGYHPI